MKDDEYLLKENTIVVNNKEVSHYNMVLYSYIYQRPNTKALGITPIGLHYYNRADPDFEKSYEQYVENHPNTKRFITAVFSKKQLKKVYDFNVAKHNSYRKNGQAPVIVNEKKTEKSIKSLKKYYENKGFFDVEVSAKEITKRKKKTVEYNVTTNNSYFLDSIKTDIATAKLAQIYKQNNNQSYLKKGAQFDGDNFVKEQLRLTKIFREAGFYYFNKDYIHYEIDMRDSTSYHKKVVLKIDNQFIDYGDSISVKPFKVQHVKNINIYTDYSFNTKDLTYKDSTTYKGYTFYSHKKLDFSPKYLSNAIAIMPNGIYKDSERILTRQYLNDLKVFKSPINIKYEKVDDENLNVNIYLTPLKKMGLNMQMDLTHANIKPFGILGKFAFVNRNIFRGSEIFELGFQGSFLNVAEEASDPDFNFFGLTSYEFGGNASFKIPRILFPVNTQKLIPKRMRPSTNFGVSTSFQKNIGLDRQNISGNISYHWQKGTKLKHQFDLLNVQYINNINSGNYFEVFGSERRKLSTVTQTIIDPANMDSNGQITNINGYINHVLNPLNNYAITHFDEFKRVQQVKERQNIITEDLLVPVISYAFTYNTKKGLKDNSFEFIRAKIASAGSLTSAFTKANDEGRKELFGLPIAQYVKAEFEFKKYWDLYNSNQVVFRSFIGAAVPFGNSKEIPFSRSYRAGGSNDIRAWRTFDLGPGSSDSNLDFNIGNLKFVGNFEYRFKLLNNIYGAAFIDAGNVWDISKSNLTSNEAKFSGFESLKDIAIGSGFGIRYDFSFLIFRADLGFKTYEPYLDKKWFRNYNVSHSVLNFGINYPF